VKKKKKSPPAGAPDWMVTYGDMVTLLLTFFVLLLAMSETKQTQRMVDFMQAVKEAFGYSGGAQFLPTDEILVPKNHDEMSLLILPIHPENMGRTSDEGPKGKRDRVTNIRPDEYYQAGGRFNFKELSAELGESEASRVVDYAKKELVGYNTMIEVRGHCNKRPVEEAGFRDHMDLSIARARAVEKILIGSGVDPQRIWVVGRGATQPIALSNADVNQRQRNDMVELIQIDKTLDEFKP